MGAPRSTPGSYNIYTRGDECRKEIDLTSERVMRGTCVPDADDAGRGLSSELAAWLWRVVKRDTNSSLCGSVHYIGCIMGGGSGVQGR